MDTQNKGKAKFYIIAAIASTILIVLDQYTKKLAVEHLMNQKAIDVIAGVFQFRYLENRGAAFGMLQDKRLLFLLIAFIITIIIGYIYHKIPEGKRYRILRVSIVFLFSGAIGNTIDRLLYGYVVDFLYIELINFPIFNVADCYVTFSAIVLIFLLLFYYKDDELDFLSFRKKPKEEI